MTPKQEAELESFLSRRRANTGTKATDGYNNNVDTEDPIKVY